MNVSKLFHKLSLECKTNLSYKHKKAGLFYLIVVISFLCLSINWNCSTGNDESGFIRILTKPGVNPEYLGMSEKIILDFYGEESDRERALETLKTRCTNPELKDPHSCYNLAVLLYNQKKPNESFDAIRNAVKIAGTDPLYLSMFRTLALQLGKPEILEEDTGTKYLGILTRLELVCGKDQNKAREIILPLVKDGIVNSAMLEDGILAECLGPELKKEIVLLSKNSIYNYKDIYYQEKIKSDPFSSLWDVGYFLKKKKLEDQDQLQSTLTENWKLVRVYTKSKDIEKARQHLKLFLGELRNHPLGKIEKKKLIALERAAYLLIEQDDFFVQSRGLIQEF